MANYEHLVFKDRRNTDCVKWDDLEEVFGQDDLLAAWVADMDIESPECVKNALHEYVEYNIHGYYKEPDSFKQAFIDWMKKYHQYEPKREWIRFAPGVVPAIYWIIRMLTNIEDSVAIMSPVYYPFAKAIQDTARTLIDIPLVRSGDTYYMDPVKFEEKVVKKNVKVFILCSPHNPVGRVWTEEELRSILNICRKYNVYVIADEIHHDIILGDRPHVSAATLGDYDSILITLTSASKTFNLAGCQNAYVVLPNDALRSKYDGFTRKINLRYGSNFGYIAYPAAYKGGREWLDEVLELIRNNYKILKKGLAEYLPEATVFSLEGTYLVWIDLEAYLKDRETTRAIPEDCRLAVDYGEWFGGEEYENFIRVNLATSPDNVKKITTRLAKLNPRG